LRYFVQSARLISIPFRRKTAAYPGNREIERRIKSLARWNAMAMVVNANHNERRGRPYFQLRLDGDALRSRLQPFLPRRRGGRLADLIYFQGHTTPGNYARAFLEYRLDEGHLHNFRRNWPRAAGFPRIRILI
jgi:pyruvate dehydrogenase E1 component